MKGREIKERAETERDKVREDSKKGEKKESADGEKIGRKVERDK